MNWNVKNVEHLEQHQKIENVNQNRHGKFETRLYGKFAGQSIRANTRSVTKNIISTDSVFGCDAIIFHECFSFLLSFVLVDKVDDEFLFKDFF